MRSLALIISLLLSLVLVSCSAYSWNDCGAPLSRIISFQNVVAYPESPDSQDRLSLSVQATVMSSFTDATTNILVTKDGVEYLAVEGRTLCTILATTQNTITCPVAPGQYSFNYVYPLPTLSAGTYTVVITFNDISSGAALGCVSTSLSVSNSASSSCRYTSSLTSTFGTTRLNTNNNSTIGSWIQIGPYGNNAGAAGSSFPWGRFVSFVGTTDVIDIAINPSPYVWGLNGSLLNATNSANGGVDSVYAGDFVIGYTPYTVSSSLANVQIISTGQFNITLNYVSGRSPRETVLTGGSLNFNPQYSLPYGFYYPLIFGGLGTFNVQQNSDGSLQASASKVWCACAIDACGVCGGDGRTCGSYLTATAAPRHTGLTSYDIAAIVIACVAFVLLIAVLVLAMMLWRRGREARNVRDDTDLAGPDKPDYGSMAINEVLADHGRPVIVA